MEWSGVRNQFWDKIRGQPGNLHGLVDMVEGKVRAGMGILSTVLQILLREEYLCLP